MQPKCRCDTAPKVEAYHIIQAVQGKSKSLFFPLWVAFAKSALQSTFYPVSELLSKAWRSICAALQLPAAVIHHCINAGADCVSGRRWFRGFSHPPTTNGLPRHVTVLFRSDRKRRSWGKTTRWRASPQFLTRVCVFLQARLNRSGSRK